MEQHLPATAPPVVSSDICGEHMENYSLRVGACDLTIKSDEPAEHIEAVQLLIAEAFTKAGGEDGRPQHTALAFAAMTLADQLIKERSAHRALKERIRSRSRDLLRTLASRSLKPLSTVPSAVPTDSTLVA